MPESKKTRSRFKKWVLGVYLILLLSSHLVCFYSPSIDNKPLGKELIELPAYKKDETLDKKIFMAYRDYAAQAVDRPVLVILHGIPKPPGLFTPFISEISEDYRLIFPDLPGFGDSSSKVPDYSSRAHARYVLALLEELGIKEAHLLGYSRGGAVALNMIDLAGETFTFQSLSIVSATGVIELELLGNYSMNKALYALQNGFFWLLHYGTPHFGWLNDQLWNYAYSRNFYDIDTRPLRRILKTVECPTLVLHGKDDFFVPVNAAREHHRIVPQSELAILQGNHFLLRDQARECATVLSSFIDRVENGEATTRASALPERVAIAAEPFDASRLGERNRQKTLILSLFLIGATWLTEDLTCITAGLLVANGSISFLNAVIACFLGIFSCDLLLYALGRFWGRRLIHRPFFRRLISKEILDRGEEWFRRNGTVIIFSTRFIPGSRLPTYITAGLMRFPFFRFLLLFILAVSLWIPPLVLLSMFFGQQIIGFFSSYGQYTLPMIIIAALLFYWLWKLLFALSHYKGRRLLLSRWIRLTRWEFWPIWVQYVPIWFYILKLMIQYRSLTLPTVVNPCIFASGLIGESKASILEALEKIDAPVPRWFVIEKNLSMEEKLEGLKNFLAQNEELDYPVVFKPDKGHRGQGVMIIHSVEDAKEYLDRARLNTIVQEYVDGKEYGVFYYRYPNEPEGQILSMNDKRFIEIVGDGRRSVEQLILSHERAVSQAAIHLKQNAGQLDRIPEEGERISFLTIGNHARGAWFFDRSDLITPELTATINAITAGYKEFYFGRYDLRVPSEEDLKLGQSIKIIELNGMASESSNMYDPKYNYGDSLKIMMRQWRVAFKIGALNRKRGFKPTPLGQTIRAFIKTRKKPLKA